jgi:hypothetical protein
MEGPYPLWDQGPTKTPLGGRETSQEKKKLLKKLDRSFEVGTPSYVCERVNNFVRWC